MEMTKTLADRLLETLTCVYISANGGCHVDNTGHGYLTEEEMTLSTEYAQKKFVEILEELEQLKNDSWKIVE